MQRLISFVGSGLAIAIAAGCATTGQQSNSQSPVAESYAVARGVTVPMPVQPTAARDNRDLPILQIGTAGKVVYPFIYGYPIYPEGDAAHGLAALRNENWAGARSSDSQDQAGVVHAVEELPALGCRFDGIRESPAKYVPMSLTCNVPAPKQLGGPKRPVLGEVQAGAKAEQLLEDKTVQDVFLGDFHLKSDDFALGDGTGFFNTTHGQLAFVFSKKKLAKIIYYFDPGVTAWQNPALWVRP
jgi:hypothetical protein